MHLNPWCKAAFLSGDMVQSPSPSVSSLTAPGTSRLQFTVPPSMYWVINYAVLPRMGTQTRRQAIKRHSASPRASHALPSLCLSPALLHQADTADTCFLHLQLHSGKMPPHFGLVRPPPHQPPQTNGWEPAKPGARGRGCGRPRRAQDQRAKGGLLTPRPRSVASSLSVPPWVFCDVTLLQPRGTPARVQSRSFFGTAPTATQGSRAPWRSRCGGTAGAAQVAREARRAHSDAAPEL